MSDAEDVVDQFSGMISLEHASRMISDQVSNAKDSNGVGARIAVVTEVLSFIESVRKSRADPGRAFKAPKYVVDVQDVIYRIFNGRQGSEAAGPKATRRIVVLGKTGSTINLNLFGTSAAIVDSKPLERGGTMLVKNAVIDVASGELDSSKATSISAVAQPTSVVNDFSMLKAGDTGIDVIGRVIEISQVRQIARFGGSVSASFCSCRIADSKNSTVAVSLFGSCATAIGKVSTQSTIKLEFCSVNAIDGSLVLSAGDNSRLFSYSRSAAGRKDASALRTSAGK